MADAVQPDYTVSVPSRTCNRERQLPVRREACGESYDSLGDEADFSWVWPLLSTSEYILSEFAALMFY